MTISKSILPVCFLLVASIGADVASAFSPAPVTLSKRSGADYRSKQLCSAVTDLSDDILTDPMFIEPLDAPPADVPNGKSPEELITIAKRFLLTSKGLGGDPDMLAETFQFEGPVVGPLPKDEFVKAIGSVDFDTAFPNWTPQFYGFHVDPLEGDRVWYTARGFGKNEGPLLPFSPEPTGRMVENPPQVCSLTIDHETGLITKYTIGYVTDRSIGNTGGLGGLYGILYAIGKPLPFPEANPWKKSKQYAFFQWIGSLINP